MSTATKDIEQADRETTEAYKTLLARVGRRSTKIPPEVLVRHVLGCVPPQEWPVRLAAMDAVLRRLDSARRDGLRISTRPGGRRLLGTYATSRPRTNVRPYHTMLARMEPIEGHCD